MDPLGLQMQLRNNSADLVNFCEELKEWGSEMNRKDESLAKKATSDDPEIITSKVRKTNNTSKITKKVKSKRIKASDYSAWEKFDVDAECAKVDEEDDNDSGDLSDEFDENRIDEAVYEKEKGNKFVKLQKWDAAIECYTKAIACYSCDPIFYANRALCHLKKQNYREAETDCTVALQYDKTYVKAYQRRAAAREALNQLTDAHGDLLKVFDYESNNKESKTALAKLEKKLEMFNKKVSTQKTPEVQKKKSKFTLAREAQKEFKLPAKPQISQSHRDQGINYSSSQKIQTYWPSGNEVELIEAINKPPHLRSRKSLKRVDVSDVVFEMAAPEITEMIVGRPPKDDTAPKPWPTMNENSKSIKCDNLKVFERKTTEDNIKTGDSNKIVKTSKFGKEKSNKEISGMESEKSDAHEFNLPPPINSIQFNCDWRLLADNPTWRYCYLKQVNPKQIPTIFKESLDCDIFSGIIHTLAESFIENNVPVYDYLLRLCEVKRFSMLKMFMSESDKNDIRKLMAYLQSDSGMIKGSVDQLLEKYIN